MEKKNKIRGIISVIVVLAAIVLAVYVGGWVLFLKPIFDCLMAFDCDTLTGMMCGVALLKIFSAGIVASAIFFTGFIISRLIAEV